MLNTVKNRWSRIQQHIREGPQEFEASIDRITSEEWDKRDTGTFLNPKRYMPVYALHFGKGTYPDYLQCIYLLALSQYERGSIVELFKQGHNVSVIGEYVPGDFFGKFEPGTNPISMFLSALSPFFIGDFYEARIIVKDKKNKKTLVECDVNFKHYDTGIPSLPNQLFIARERHPVEEIQRRA